MGGIRSRGSDAGMPTSNSSRSMRLLEKSVSQRSAIGCSRGGIDASLGGGGAGVAEVGGVRVVEVVASNVCSAAPHAVSIKPAAMSAGEADLMRLTTARTHLGFL